MKKHLPSQETAPTVYEARNLLRKQMLTKRKQLSPHTHAEYALLAQQRVLNLPAWKQATRVLLYVSVRNELATNELLNNAWHTGKQVLLPRCMPDVPGEMILAACTSIHQLIPGCFGILEPDASCCPAIDINESGHPLDVAIIPGVAFDRHGNRLGYGGGYYDRILAHSAMQQTTCIGFAYDFQLIEQLPIEPWDRPVHAICTEKELIWIPRSHG